MKQTAVEWLMEQLPTIDKYDPYYQNLFMQAKAMEKEHIIEAFHKQTQKWFDIEEAEQYYNETFKSQ